METFFKENFSTVHIIKFGIKIPLRGVEYEDTFELFKKIKLI